MKLKGAEGGHEVDSVRLLCARLAADCWPGVNKNRDVAADLGAAGWLFRGSVAWKQDLNRNEQRLGSFSEGQDRREVE